MTEAAKKLGVSRAALSRLINEQAGVSPEMATRFEKAGWSTADTWTRMQAAYDLAQARRHEDEIVEIGRRTPFRPSPPNEVPTGS